MLFRDSVLLLKISLSLLVAVMVTGLSSCGDDKDGDAPRDTAAPVVSFSNLNASDIVWNTIIVKLNVSDNDVIKTVELYIDGSLVSTVSAAPYEFTWDSNSVPDGPHFIKVAVLDEAGNRAETQINIGVRNILISIDVPENQVMNTDDYAVREFVVLTDEHGDLITYAEVQNGETLELRAPSFSGTTFQLSEVLYYREGLDGWVQTNVFTFPEIDRGKWTLFAEGTLIENTTQATLNFQNAENGKTYLISSNYDNRWQSPQTAAFDETVELIASPSKLFIQKIESETPVSFRLIPSVTTGNNPSIDLGQGWQALSSVTGNVPEGLDQIYSSLWGYSDPENDEERYFVGAGQYVPEENKMIVYRPGDAFPRYEHYYEFGKDNYFVSKSSSSLDMSFTPIEHTLDVEMTTEGFDFVATGDFDFSFTVFRDPEFGTAWIFVVPGNAEGPIAVPELPEEIAEFMDAPQFDFSGPYSYELHDLAAFDSYEEVISAMRRGISSAEANSDFASMEVYVSEDDGGRLASPSWKKYSRNWLQRQRKHGSFK